MGTSRMINASKQNKMGAVDARRDQRKSGLKQQKANTILQMKLQHTQVQLITLSWYDSTSNHQKECSKKWPNTAVFPYPTTGDSWDFPLQISQANNLWYIYELKK